MIRFALNRISHLFFVAFSTFLLIIIGVQTTFAAGGISVYPDKSLIIQIVNFIVLIWALNKVLYKPIRNVLIQRKEKIDGMQHRIDDFNTDIEEKDEAFESGIKEARVKGLKEKEGLITSAAEEEKATLDNWILEHAGDPLYRFGHQQVGDIVDPSSQTEDLGDDAIKASAYGIENLKRILPKLEEWTAEDGKNYDDLEKLYDQVIAQFNRYMVHVSNNIGGVYEHHKTYDQEGAVYTPVPKEHQANCMQFVQEQLFSTPVWLLDQNIFSKTQYSGFIEQVRAMQVRTLNRMLSLGKMARLIENETANGSEAYRLLDMMRDLRNGIWSELRNGKTIDTYRRNLQKAHIDRLEYLMTAENQKKKPEFGGYQKSTVVNTSQSDIRSVAREELNILRGTIRSAIGRTSDSMSKYHLQDAAERITAILEPAR